MMLGLRDLAKAGLVTVLAVMLAACATPNVSSDYALSDASGKGVAVGSITYSGLYAGYLIHYRKLDDKTVSGYFHYGQTRLAPMRLSKGDIEQPMKNGQPGQRGDLFAAELPAGDYEIHGWEVRAGSIHAGPTEPFSVHFKVQAGQAVYLGNYLFKRTAERTGFMPTGFEVTAQDESERDLQIFASKYPGLAKTEVTAGIGKNLRYEQVGGRSQATITMVTYVPVR